MMVRTDRAYNHPYDTKVDLTPTLLAELFDEELIVALKEFTGDVRRAYEIRKRDPVGGLVQIPCIERNAIAAVKAVSVARLALHGNGRHKVSLDQVIATMRQTGLDMDARYKETSMAGLAVNVVEC